MRLAVKRLCLLVLALVMFSACKKDPPILEEGIAKVRFVNAYMNADPQDFYQDQEKLTNNAIAYLEYSDYLTVKSGQSVIWSNNAIENKATAAVDGILYNGYQYTLFYFQTKDSKPAIAGYINEVKTPASGKFKVRFLNLSTSFNDKPLVITGANTTVINAALNYGDNPIYTELPVNSEIKVGIKDNSNVTILNVNEFKEAKSYSIWFDTTDGVKVNYHVVQQ